MRCVSRGESGACLTEFEVAYISGRLTRHLWKRKMAIVQYQSGQKIREMVQVWVTVKKGKRKMWADAITGSLFRDNGSCIGSSRVRIVGWV